MARLHCEEGFRGGKKRVHYACRLAEELADAEAMLVSVPHLPAAAQLASLHSTERQRPTS